MCLTSCSINLRRASWVITCGPIVSAAETESAYRIIRRLRAAHSTLAAVFDDERKLTGIVTVEDLVRRLVQSA